MNSGMERYKKKRLAVSVITVSVLIILIQFIDSYCTEIFGRTQSLSARTFLMIPKGMDGDPAIAYMSRMMLPFYLIGMLTPFVRSYTDIIGRKRMLIINVSLLVAGSVICIFAENLPVYLLGNGVLILGYSLDIHMIYIVDVIDRRYRATVRGICGGVSMAAAMCIPLLRSRCVSSDGGNWQILFWVGIIGGMLCLTLVTAYRFPENGADDIQNAMEDGEAICKVSAVKETFGDENRALEAEKHGSSDKENDKHIHFIRTLGTLWKQPDTKGLLIGISAVGLATAGITYYNEPLCAFSGMGEQDVNTVLLVQPVISLIINVVTGVLADMVQRTKIVRLGIACSFVFGMAFTFGAGHTHSALLLGVLWGCMHGFYFSAEELINLMVMESVKPEVRGRASAASTLAYGIGDQLGIFAISLIVGALGMRITKLLFIGIPLVLAAVLIRQFTARKTE